MNSLESLKVGSKAIVLKVELDTYEQDMCFTDEMAKNIGTVVTISRKEKYLDDFYTIVGDDNYNAYHISWLYPIKDLEKLQAIESADLSRAQKNFNIIYDVAGEYADLVGLNRSDTINCNKERVDNFFNKSKLLESKVREFIKGTKKGIIDLKLQQEIQALLGGKNDE